MILTSLSRVILASSLLTTLPPGVALLLLILLPLPLTKKRQFIITDKKWQPAYTPPPSLPRGSNRGIGSKKGTGCKYTFMVFCLLKIVKIYQPAFTNFMIIPINKILYPNTVQFVLFTI